MTLDELRKFLYSIPIQKGRTQSCQFIRFFLNNKCDVNLIKASNKYATSLISHFCHHALIMLCFKRNYPSWAFQSFESALKLLEGYPLFKQEMAELMDYLKGTQSLRPTKWGMAIQRDWNYMVAIHVKRFSRFLIDRQVKRKCRVWHRMPFHPFCPKRQKG